MAAELAAMKGTIKMTIHKCNQCGKEVDTDNYEDCKEWLTGHTVTTTQGVAGSEHRDFHYCPKCKIKFEMFIHVGVN